MKKTIMMILILCMTLSLLSCSSKVKTVEGSDSLYVRKIEGLPEDFIFGMDASSVPSLEKAGVKYYDYSGEEADVFKVLAESGITHIRVRVWNDPYDSEGHGYGGGNCDIDTAVEIGKRATKYGMKLIVDFHYSDFWADPAKQFSPKAWEGMEIEEKAAALYDFTRASLEKLKKERVDVGMVSLGNETNGKMAGESIWMNIIYHLMASGSRAVREVFPKALVAVHFANPENSDAYFDYAKKLAYYDLDYDVFASSYYPYWHGTLQNLRDTLSAIAEQYDKKVMVMETSYAYTGEDSDYFANTIGDGGAFTKNYPFTLQGQTNCLLDTIEALSHTSNAIGICYWEGTWITAGGNSYEENLSKWEEFGCGWASSYAKEYDPNDAGKWYGGSAVDNQTFFDPSGHPLESLKVFALCQKGNEVEVKADAVEDAEIDVDLNGSVVLPDKVMAIMNDNTRKEVNVTWEAFDEADMKSHGPKKYDIKGTADGLEAHCYVNMIEYNFLKNPSFEEDSDKTSTPSGWVVEDHRKADQLYVEEKQTDSLSGKKHYHFWSSAQGSVDFDLYQEIDDLPDGGYRFQISAMGGDCGTGNCYAYVMIDGVQILSYPFEMTGYNNWKTSYFEVIPYKEGQVMRVGVHIECQGEGNGAWGKIDDAMLNSIGD